MDVGAGAMMGGRVGLLTNVVSEPRVIGLSGGEFDRVLTIVGAEKEVEVVSIDVEIV
jgi:hypothetical protein